MRRRYPLWFSLFLMFALTSTAILHPVPRLVFNSSYSPPYTTEAGDGILDRILREAGRRIGYEVVIRRLPAERCLIDAAEGFADGDVARVHGIDAFYPSLIRIPVPTILSRDFVAFTKKPLRDGITWNDLRHYNIAYVKGWKIIEVNLPPAKSALAVGSTPMLFRLLAKDRVDVVISARLDGLAMAGRLGLEDIRIIEPALVSRELFPYLNRRHAHLVPSMAQALREMQADGAYDAIYLEVLGRFLEKEDIPFHD